MFEHDETLMSDLDHIVERVIETADPLRVVLFGSWARGEASSESDIDLMVLVPDGTRRLDVLKKLYALGIPRVDFVVTTPELYDARKRNANFVHFDIERDGRSLYAA